MVKDDSLGYYAIVLVAEYDEKGIANLVLFCPQNNSMDIPKSNYYKLVKME